MLLTLAVTPARRWLGWAWAAPLRRTFGLAAFSYACLHLATYVGLDHFFDFDAIVEDDDDRALETLPDFSTGELRFLAVTEDVERLADLLQRRSDLAFTGRLSREIFAEVAEAVAPVLGWDEARVGSEIARTMDQLAALHGWQASADANIPA